MMTIDELLAKVPAELRPVALEYGPALLKMTAESTIYSWLSLIAAGKTREAYKLVVKNMPNAELFAEAEKIDGEWYTANASNNAMIKTRDEAIAMVLKALLTMAVSAALL